MTAQVDSSDVFVQYRPRPERWLAVGATVGVVLLLLGGVAVARATIFSPSATVVAYFEALSNRDAERALALLIPRQEGDRDSRLIAGSLLQSEDYLPPSELEIINVARSDQRAEVQVSYRIAGQRHEASLLLRRSEALVDRFAQRWRIVDGTGMVRLVGAPPTAAVNGVTVVVHEGGFGPTMTALPGGYRVGATKDDPLWQRGEVRFAVAPQRVTEAHLRLRPRPEVQAAVEQQIRSRLDRCAESTALSPPRCPFGNTRIARASNVEWQISRYPQVTFSANSDGRGPAVMSVESRVNGEANVTGIESSFRGSRPFDIAVPFPVTGMVSLRGDTVVFEPGW